MGLTDGVSVVSIEGLTSFSSDLESVWSDERFFGDVLPGLKL